MKTIKKLIIYSFILCTNLAYGDFEKTKFVRGEILVKFKNGVSQTSKINALRANGASNIQSYDKLRINHVKIPEGKDLFKAIDDLARNPDVEFAQPNYIYRALRLPNDPSFSQSWGMRNTAQTIVVASGGDTPSSTNNPGVSGKDMSLANAWDVITDCSTVLVAVVDSGVNYNHQDLTGNMWNGGASYPYYGYDFVDNDNNPMDKDGHGTHVAGIIGSTGNNSVGTSGVCWKSKIMAVRVLDAVGSGLTSQIIAGINFAVSQGAKIINLSLGMETYDAALSASIDNARTNGVLIVAAAGNDSRNLEGGTSMYPCAFTQDNVLCVAGLDQAYSLATYSNYGSTSVDVGAPGTNILSDWNGSYSTLLTDPLTSGWTNSTLTGSSWGYKSINFNTARNCLVYPSNYDYSAARYLNSSDSKIWKNFNLGTGDGFILKFNVMYDYEQDYDGVILYSKSTGGDPVTGSVLDAFTGTTSGYSIPVSYDVSQLASSTTSFGFRSITDNTNNDFGINVSNLAVRKLTISNTLYNVISGTSMATPHVTGLAALLLAYNQNYSYLDLIEAIKAGAISTPSLVGKTTVGKAVNAQGAISYIQQVKNVTGAQQP